MVGQAFIAGFATGLIVAAVSVCVGAWLGLRSYRRDLKDLEDGFDE